MPPSEPSRVFISYARQRWSGSRPTAALRPQSNLRDLARHPAPHCRRHLSREIEDRFMEVGRSASGNGTIRHPFLTVPVPRVETIKKIPQGMTPDLDQPFHRNLALGAVADFVAGKKRKKFSSEEAEDVYDASRHTILQEQRLLACQTSWLAAVNVRTFTSTLEKRRSASHVLTVNALVTHYREEKMPKRTDTRRSYEVWLRNHILPRWGECSLNEVQARPVELWLGALTLSPKSKAHIRGFAQRHLGLRDVAR